MLSNGTESTASNVRSADILAQHEGVDPEDAKKIALLLLEHCDADASKKIAALRRSDQSQQKIAAELVLLGVNMYQMIEMNRDAWDDFKKPFEVKVYGSGDERDFREVAAVLWRSVNREPVERRQKRSLYSHCIGTVQGWYENGLTDPEKLLTKIINTRGGLKSVAKLRKDKLAHGARTDIEDRRRRRWIKIGYPQVVTLFAITPEGEALEIDAAVAAPVLAQMGLVQ